MNVGGSVVVRQDLRGQSAYFILAGVVSVQTTPTGAAMAEEVIVFCVVLRSSSLTTHNARVR